MSNEARQEYIYHCLGKLRHTDEALTFLRSTLNDLMEGKNVDSHKEIIKLLIGDKNESQISVKEKEELEAAVGTNDYDALRKKLRKEDEIDKMELSDLHKAFHDYAWGPGARLGCGYPLDDLIDSLPIGEHEISCPKCGNLISIAKEETTPNALMLEVDGDLS